MKQYILGMMAFSLIALSAQAEEKQLTSLDGRLVVTVSDNQGCPSYQINYDGKAFLQPSALGLNTNVGDYTHGLTMTHASDVTTIKESYSLSRIKKSKVDVDAHRQVFTF